MPTEIGNPTHLLADAGDANTDYIEELQSTTDIEVYVSVHREDGHDKRQYDYRPAEKLKQPKLKKIHPTLRKENENQARDCRRQSDLQTEKSNSRNHLRNNQGSDGV